LRNNRNNAFADIDVQLKQRFDLIPNLVETVKGYANHEKETLENVIKARNAYMNAGSISDKINADNQLTETLKTLFAVSESYPDLKASSLFSNLQMELSDIENKLSAVRRFFNAATKEYNTAIQTFPGNIIANIFNFKIEGFFEIPEAERTAPKVQF
jgi:hypothetical protein